jgi:hypothetical protein
MSAALSGKTPGQVFALVFGAIYVLVGVVGFFVTTDGGEGTLIAFDVNALHNIVHLAIGGALLYASRTVATSKQMNLILGAVLTLVAILGFAGVIVEDLMNANAADHMLHLATGVLALYFGTAGAGARAATA